MSQPQLQTSFLKFGSQIQVEGFHKILLLVVEHMLDEGQTGLICLDKHICLTHCPWIASSRVQTV